MLKDLELKQLLITAELRLLTSGVALFLEHHTVVHILMPQIRFTPRKQEVIAVTWSRRGRWVGEARGETNHVLETKQLNLQLYEVLLCGEVGGMVVEREGDGSF